MADGVVDEQVCIVEGVVEPFRQLTNAGLQDRLRSEVPVQNHVNRHWCIALLGQNARFGQGISGQSYTCGQLHEPTLEWSSVHRAPIIEQVASNKLILLLQIQK